MRKKYIVPALTIAIVTQEMPVAQSNTVTETSANLNPETMEEGNGGDAVKASFSYNVWDDDWSN